MRLLALLVLLAHAAGAAAASGPPIRLQVVPDEQAAAPATGFDATVGLAGLVHEVRRQRLELGHLAAPIEVVVRGGTYRLRSPLELGSVESNDLAGLTIAAAPGERVVWSGAWPVPALGPAADRPLAGLLPEAARGHVLVAKLPAEWRNSLGEIRRRSLGEPASGLTAELLLRGTRLPLARWPDAGFATIADTPDGRRGARLAPAATLPPGLEREPALWAFGHWAADWAPERLRVTGVDSRANLLTLASPLPRYGIRAGQRFYLENALAALDQPGEWYLDRERGDLYLWPPAGISPDELELSLAETILSLRGATGVRVDGLVLEATRGDALVIAGGSDNVARNCTIRLAGNRGARISGSGSGLERCLIEETGDTAVLLDGGDRATLEPADLFVADSEIRRFGVRTTASTAGISVRGVGNRVVRNHVHDGPHMGIRFAGNDHVIEDNLVHDVVQDTYDAGAIHLWGDWGQRGTLVRGNTICNIWSKSKFAIGIYLDLLASGTAIIGNRMLDVQWGILVNGGSDNLVADNVFVGSEIPLRFEAIGLTWSRKAVDDGGSPLRRPLRGLPLAGSLWAGRYPGLTLALAGDPGMPKRNAFERNTVYGDNLGRITSQAKDYTVNVGNELRPRPARAELRRMFPAECFGNGTP